MSCTGDSETFRNRSFCLSDRQQTNAGEEHDKSIRSRKQGCPRMARRCAKTEVPLQSRPRFRFASIRAIRGQNTDFISPAKEYCFARQPSIMFLDLGCGRTTRRVYSLSKTGVPANGANGRENGSSATIPTAIQICVHPRDSRAKHGLHFSCEGILSLPDNLQSCSLIWAAGEARAKYNQTERVSLPAHAAEFTCSESFT